MQVATKIVRPTSGHFWIFIHETMKTFIVLMMMNSTAETRFDGTCSTKDFIDANCYMAQFYPEYIKFKARPVPISFSFRTACEFINKHHRHHNAPQGMKFAIGMSNGQKTVGVLIAGRPVSRHRDDGLTLEVTRLCVLQAYRHVCSQLYAVARRIARELGYRSIITYTLEEESGASLRAIGFQLVGVSNRGSWNSSMRKREDKHPIGRKKNMDPSDSEYLRTMDCLSNYSYGEEDKDGENNT
ncbi:GNAT family N-acetyltransferase [Bacillus cereus]|nr:GNAT family N-acetyltransferase [Bacillus cereus]